MTLGWVGNGDVGEQEHIKYLNDLVWVFVLNDDVHCKKWIFQKNVNMTSKDDEIAYLLFQETFQLSYQFWMVIDKFVFPDYSLTLFLKLCKEKPRNYVCFRNFLICISITFLRLYFHTAGMIYTFDNICYIEYPHRCIWQEALDGSCRAANADDLWIDLFTILYWLAF